MMLMAVMNVIEYGVTLPLLDYDVDRRFVYLFGTHYKINRIHVANFMIVFFTFLSTASIVVNVVDLF
jgi:hypothetical protein